MSEEPSVLAKLAAQLKAECTGFARIALLGQNITESDLERLYDTFGCVAGSTHLLNALITIATLENHQEVYPMAKENRADDLRMLLRAAFDLTDLAQDQVLMDGPKVLPNIIHDLQQLLERLGGPYVVEDQSN